MCRMMLADDHEIVRSGIRNALTSLPNVEIVGEVGNGLALFAALTQTRPDCLLIDVAMPDFDALVDIKQIRAQYPQLKILVVSAHDDDIYVQGLLGVGVNGYHLKDQSLNDLRLAVQRVLQGERWISSRLLEKLMPQTAAQTAVPAITERQREILMLLQQGLDNQSIARQMGLSVKTIENHLTRIYRQLNVQSRLEAVNFTMTHPQLLHPTPRPLTAAPLKSAAVPNGVSILLVDDNARYRHQLRRIIGQIHPQAAIHEAHNTAEAVRQTERIQPNLALVDMVLGDENGIECVRRLKTNAAALRVILMSAYPDREFHRLGLQAGAAAFLDKKDVDAAALRQMIEDVL
ncbi:MAG: response regulator transcription factor [Anaerolineales bacterium]|nr:response regulator transcription factor [Anaerolineales bacterium]